MATWFTIALSYMLYSNAAKLMNVKVTMNKSEMHSLFDDGEIWGMQYQNVSEGIMEVEVVIDEAKAEKILQYPTVMGFEIVHHDAEETIRHTMTRVANRTRWNPNMKPDLFFQEYRNWPEYEVFLQFLSFSYPDLVTLDYLPGQTYEGREIPVVIVTTDGDFSKPGFYLQACLHAREWIANSALVYILNALLEGYRQNDDTMRRILEGVNFFIVPTVNVDGYIYTWQSSATRMWRKNRRPNTGGSFGVDLNRNYYISECTWCGVGASSNPSSDTYCGTGAFSEPETEASKMFMTDSSYNIQAAWDMHTSGPLILSPYGCMNEMPEQFVTLGARLSDAVYSVNGMRYVFQSAYALYPCTGTAVDFGYADSAMNDGFSFTFEGRGPGFNPPASNIILAGEEELAAVVVMAEQLMGPDMKK